MASTTETGTTTQQANADGFQVEKGLRGRDEFYKETYRFFDALAHHRKAVMVGAALVVGACIAGGLVMNRHEAKSQAGRDALFVAVKAYETELKGLAGVKPPVVEAPEAPEAKTDPKVKEAKEAALKARRAEDDAASKRMDELSFAKLDVDAKFPEGVKKYQAVIAQFDGTRAAYEARMALGTLYFNHGEAAKASPVFQEAGKAASGSFEKSLALLSWGYALENESKFAEANSAFEKALNYSEGSIKSDTLLAIARTQVAMHDSAKARSTYDQILNLFPNTDSAKAAEALKAKL